MRIAITGTHGVGKTTLAEDLIEVRPDWELVPEPCWVFSDGMAFLDGPDIASFEEQLEQSCALLLDDGIGPNAVFDRCPLDFLAYLDVLGAQERDEWHPPVKVNSNIERAMDTLDLIVFVPLVEPDDMAAEFEFPKLRRNVDRRLKAILHDDGLDLLAAIPHVKEVGGSREQRLADIIGVELTL